MRKFANRPAADGSTHRLLGASVVPYVLLMTVFVSSCTALPAVPAAKQPCDATEYRQLDFWLGNWSVTDGTTGDVAGTSRIERDFGGCAIREHWSSALLTGGSLNVFDRNTKRWHQFWVDSSGARREFIGGLVSMGGGASTNRTDQMVLIANVPSPANPNATIQVRMTFSVNADGSVRQYSDLSRDGGSAWKFRYDYLYRKSDAR